MKKYSNLLFMLTMSVLMYFAGPFVSKAILERYPIYAADNTHILNTKIHQHHASIASISVGEYGDLFGSLNSLFTAASLFLLAASFFYQTHTYSRESERNAIRDMENNFFNMLSRLSDIVSTIDVRKTTLRKNHKEIIVSGTEALQTICESFIAHAQNMKEKGLNEVAKRKIQNLGRHRKIHGTALQRDWNGYRVAVLEAANGKSIKFIPYEKYSSIAFRYCFYKYNHDLAHYINFCYRILKYVDSSAVEYARKIELISILRANLSSPELTILFYHCLSGYGSNTKFLAEKYALFDNIDKSALFDAKRECALFLPSAFSTTVAKKNEAKKSSISWKIIQIYKKNKSMVTMKSKIQ